MIPKIIHQIWFQGENNIPEEYPNYSKSWKKLNPEYKYIFWSGDKMRKLIKEKYPWFLKRYDEYPNMIQRIDSAKYFILHQFGGLLPDLDCECIKPITPLIEGKKFLAVDFGYNMFEQIVSMTALEQINWTFFQNGLLGSIKGHPCWEVLHKNLLKEDLKQQWYENRLKYIFRSVGPSMFTRSIYEYGVDKVDTINKRFADPVKWCDFKGECTSSQQCRIKYPDAYTIHHYGSRNPEITWLGVSWSAMGSQLFCKYKDRIMAITSLIILGILAFIRNRDECGFYNLSCLIRKANDDFIIILITTIVYFMFLH